VHASTVLVASGPPENAVEEAHVRLGELIDRGRIDYYSVGMELLHAWRAPRAEREDTPNPPGVAWCEDIPLPLSDELLVAIYISPARQLYWAPLHREKDPQWPRWVRRLNNHIERGRRRGDCVVIADVHV